jgi:hypothetical protein
MEGNDLVPGHKGVRCGAHDLDVRILGKLLGEDLPHHRRIVDDQHFDPVMHAHPSS